MSRDPIWLFSVRHQQNGKMGKSFQVISCSLSTALLTWSLSCQPLCHTPPGALPVDWACIPCRSSGPRSTFQPPVQAQWGEIITSSPGLPTLLVSQNTSIPSCHLARELTRRNNHNNTTQFFLSPKKAPLSIHCLRGTHSSVNLEDF